MNFGVINTKHFSHNAAYRSSRFLFYNIDNRYVWVASNCTNHASDSGMLMNLSKCGFHTLRQHGKKCSHGDTEATDIECQGFCDS